MFYQDAISDLPKLNSNDEKNKYLACKTQYQKEQEGQRLF